MQIFNNNNNNISYKMQNQLLGFVTLLEGGLPLLFTGLSSYSKGVSVERSSDTSCS